MQPSLIVFVRPLSNISYHGNNFQITKMKSDCIFEFEDEETSDVDDESVGKIKMWLDGQTKESLGGNRPEIVPTHSTITIHSTESLAYDTINVPWEDVEIGLSQMMPEKDECGKAWHMLSSCSHQMDWSNCQVDIQPIHLASWQADNPYINPAWLFKEINRVMKNRLDLKSAWKRSTTLLMSSYPLLRTTN